MENFVDLVRKGLSDKDSSFSEISKCFLSFLKSKQLSRPFPIQLLTNCLNVYRDRLQQAVGQIRLALNSKPDMVAFVGSATTQTQQKIESDLVKLLTLEIDVQIHLGK